MHIGLQIPSFKYLGETAVTHIAIQETLNDKAVEWLEHVTDEQYQVQS